MAGLTRDDMTGRKVQRVATKTRLTPTERLTRGLTYTALGPVDITRGALGLGAAGAQSTVRRLRTGYEKGQLSKELAAAQDAIAEQFAAAQEAVANLPQVIAEARQPKRRRRGLWIAGGVAALVVGAVTFTIVRRSMQPEPSPRPPSVDVDPKP